MEEYIAIKVLAVKVLPSRITVDVWPATASAACVVNGPDEDPTKASVVRVVLLQLKGLEIVIGDPLVVPFDHLDRVLLVEFRGEPFLIDDPADFFVTQRGLDIGALPCDVLEIISRIC
jgi:hypothetical protein